MRYLRIIFLLLLCSCNSFDEDSALKYQDELLNIIVELEPYDITWLDSDEIDSYITADISDLSIDYIVRNLNRKNSGYSGLMEQNDSLVIFINTSSSFGNWERRIIYDFSKNPRNFGNESIPSTSYKLIQLDERWYYSEIEFD